MANALVKSSFPGLEDAATAPARRARPTRRRCVAVCNSRNSFVSATTSFPLGLPPRRIALRSWSSALALAPTDPRPPLPSLLEDGSHGHVTCLQPSRLLRPVRISRDVLRRFFVLLCQQFALVHGLESLGVIRVKTPRRPRLRGDFLGGFVENLERRRGLVRHLLSHRLVDAHLVRGYSY